LEIKKLVAVLVASFPASKVTAETVAAYERMLADLDYQVANAAVERLLATAKWLPTIAEIRESCLALTVGEKTPGGEAWGSVLAAIKGAGYYRTPGVDFQFSDELVLRCVRLMGWRELCLSENMPADRARFIELYDRLAATQRVHQLADGLPALKRLQAARPDLPAARGPTSIAGAISNVLRLAHEGGS
jgi:hypothetical protein